MSTPRHLLVPSLVLAAVLLGGCGGDDDSTIAADPAGGDAVTLEGSSFTPDSLGVAVGAEVTFDNQDPYAHTITSAEDSAVEFSSGELAGGDSFAQSFDEAGTYAYFCEIHPTMQGEIVVS